MKSMRMKSQVKVTSLALKYYYIYLVPSSRSCSRACCQCSFPSQLRPKVLVASASSCSRRCWSPKSRAASSPPLWASLGRIQIALWDNKRDLVLSGVRRPGDWRAAGGTRGFWQDGGRNTPGGLYWTSERESTVGGSVGGKRLALGERADARGLFVATGIWRFGRMVDSSVACCFEAGVVERGWSFGYFFCF